MILTALASAWRIFFSSSESEAMTFDSYSLTVVQPPVEVSAMRIKFIATFHFFHQIWNQLNYVRLGKRNEFQKFIKLRNDFFIKFMLNFVPFVFEL